MTIDMATYILLAFLMHVIFQSLESLSLNHILYGFSNTERGRTEQGHHGRFIKK